MQSLPVFWYPWCFLVSPPLCNFLTFTCPVNSLHCWLVFSLALVHNSIWAIFTVIETVDTNKEPILSWRARTKDGSGIARIIYIEKRAAMLQQGEIFLVKLFSYMTRRTISDYMCSIAAYPLLMKQRSWLSAESKMSIWTQVLLQSDIASCKEGDSHSGSWTFSHSYRSIPFVGLCLHKYMSMPVTPLAQQSDSISL